MTELLCFARRKNGDWEAFCADLDVAVQGNSFDDVHAALKEAVSDYLSAARQESPEDFARLSKRRAPWHVRALWIWRVAWSGMMSRGYLSASFPVTCPA
jgi:hypothetical protein